MIVLVSITGYAQEAFLYNSKGKRDPFIPLITKDGRLISLETDEKKGELSLEGIIYDPHGISYAIIDGSVVKIGDMVRDFQVLKIEKNKAFLIKEGQIYALVLKEEEK